MRMNIFSGELYHGESRLMQRPDINSRITVPQGVSQNDEQLWTNLFWIVRWELEQFVGESPNYYSPLWNACALNDWDCDAADKLIDRAVLIANFDDVSDDPSDLCERAAVPAIKMAQGALWVSNERAARDSGMPREMFDEALEWAQNEKEFLNEVRQASRTNHSGGGYSQSGWGNKNQGDGRLSSTSRQPSNNGHRQAQGGWGQPVAQQQQREERQSPYRAHNAPARSNRPVAKSTSTGTRRSFVSPTTMADNNPLEEKVPTTEYTGEQTPMRTTIEPANPLAITNQIHNHDIYASMLEILSGSEEFPKGTKVQEASNGQVIEGSKTLEVNVPIAGSKFTPTITPLTMGAIAVKAGLGQRIHTIEGFVDNKTLIIKEEFTQENLDVDYKAHLLGQRRPSSGSKKHSVNYAAYKEVAEEGNEGALLSDVEAELVTSDDFLIASGTCCEAVPAALNAQRRSKEDEVQYAHEYHMTLIRPLVLDDAEDAAMTLLRQARDIESFVNAYTQLSREAQVMVEQRCMTYANKLLVGSLCIEAELETFDELGDVATYISERPDWGGKSVATLWTQQIPKILAFASRSNTENQEEDVRSVYAKWDSLDGQDLNLVHTFATNVSTLVIPNLLGELEIDCTDDNRMVVAKWSHPELYDMIHTFVRRLRQVEVDVIRLVLDDATYEILPVMAVSGAYTLTKM